MTTDRMNFSGKIVLSSLFLASALVLAGCSTTTQTDLNIDDLYFPIMMPEKDPELLYDDEYDRPFYVYYDRITFGNVRTGRLELMGNCIVFHEGDFKSIVLWDNETEVKKVGRSIVITHPRFSPLKVGQKARFIGGTTLGGGYNPQEARVEPTTIPQKCKPDGHIEAFEWYTNSREERLAQERLGLN